MRDMRLNTGIIVSLLFLLFTSTVPIDAFIRRFRNNVMSLVDQETASQTQQSQHQQKIETFLDLVRSYNYQAKEYDVTTDDGYILTIHRMPGASGKKIKPAVLCVHGLLAASDVWALRGPDKDLAFMLVDAGYDVWLMNVRGNYYARRHKKLAPKEDKFWRFSWHEAGIYDMATSIDHIIETTGVKKVSLITHSMGTTMALVLLSERPEYNDKVNVLLSFAPIAIFTHFVPGPIGTIAVRYGRQLQKTFKSLGVNEVFPRNRNLLSMYTTFCQMPHIEILCQTLMLNFAGLLKNNRFDAFDVEMMPKVLQHYPQGSSLDTLLHYRQIMLSGKFRQYDFGPDSNYIRYGNKTPPEYHLERITVPIVLYYGMNDAYTTEEDVTALMAKLPNAEGRAITHERFSHLDFLFSNFTRVGLYSDAMRTLKQHRDDDSSSANNSTTESTSLGKAIEGFLKFAPTTVIV